jgi:hypothetical protein
MYYKKKIDNISFFHPSEVPRLEENQAKDDKLMWEIMKKKRKY